MPVVVYRQAVEVDKDGSDSNTWCIWFVAVIINIMISSIMKIIIRLNVMVSISSLFMVSFLFLPAWCGSDKLCCAYRRADLAQPIPV